MFLAALLLHGAAAAAEVASLRGRIEAAAPGEIIELEPGSRWTLDLRHKHFEKPVVIRSADPENPAVLHGMRLYTVSNLVFEDLHFVFNEERWPIPRGRGVLVMDSADLRFSRIHFEGTLLPIRRKHGDDNLYRTSVALYVIDTAGIVIEDCTFHDMARGVGLHRSQNIHARGNLFFDMRSEGFNFIQVEDVLVEENEFRDFRAANVFGDHRDMIQFWTTRTDQPSRNITIRNNFFDSGDGDWTQSIFMRNEEVDLGRSGEEMFYRNILIENNVIRNSHVHGIAVGETIGLVIRNNTILHNDHRSNSSPAIRVAERSRDVVIERNISRRVPDPADPSWRVEDNLSVQDRVPGRPGWYGDLFVNALSPGPADLAALKALPDTEITRRSLGAAATRAGPPERLTAAIRPLPEPGSDTIFTFDASFTEDAGGRFLADDATFRWDFGDGTLAEGMVVRHAYAAPGTYEISLEVVRASDGARDTARARVRVPDPLLLSLAIDAEGRLQDRSVHGSPMPEGGVKTAPGPKGAPALRFAGPKASLTLPRQGMRQIHRLDRFAMAFDLRAERPGALFTLHKSFDAAVTPDGELEFGFATDRSGYVKMRTRGADLLGGGWRQVAIFHDTHQGKAAVFVDGEPRATAAAEGFTPPLRSWGLVFGSLWGRSSFTGDLADFRVYGAPIKAALQ